MYGRFHGRDRGGLGIVNKQHAALLADDLDAMGRGHEIGEHLPGQVDIHAKGATGQIGGLHIGLVVDAG